MNGIARGRIRSSIVGVAVLLGSLAAVVGSAHVSEAMQPQPVTAVSAGDADPGDDVNLCYYTRACWE